MKYRDKRRLPNIKTTLGKYLWLLGFRYLLLYTYWHWQRVMRGVSHRVPEGADVDLSAVEHWILVDWGVGLPGVGQTYCEAWGGLDPRAAVAGVVAVGARAVRAGAGAGYCWLMGDDGMQVMLRCGWLRYSPPPPPPPPVSAWGSVETLMTTHVDCKHKHKTQ